jgi:hypothetical protein
VQKERQKERMGSRTSLSRRAGIPIPSFASISHVPASPPVLRTIRKAPWNPTTLKQVVAALQIRRIAKSIKVADFYQAVHLIPVIADNSHAPEHGLDKGERILVDLLCATSPTLYKWGENEGTLEVVSFSGNRFAELQKQLHEPEILVSKYEQCLIQVLNFRKSTNQKAEAPPAELSSERNGKKSAFPLLRTDMSLEERVRARAAAREVREQDATDSTVSVDASALLRLADALWSHSAHIFRRQSQVQATSPARRGSTASKACVMTLKDIVTNFGGSFAPSQQSTTHVARIEKATRKQIVEAVQELNRLAPEWITFSDKELTKSTTVWVNTIDYQAIRTKLGAPATPAQLQTPVNGKRPSVTEKPVVTHSHVKPNVVEVATKRQRIELKGAGAKRPATPFAPVSSPPRKKSKGLRVNPYLILTDADYDGGMVIQPSDESPRGLKRMFTQMNAGKRI